MRVIGGSAKKTLLKGPKGLDTRPTSDKVKESVFNILLRFIEKSNFLDLFSGTGSIAIEALSRGACSAVLVEKNIKNVSIIKENLKRTKLSDRAKILVKDVFGAIKFLHSKKAEFDIIYMDPPYKLNIYNCVLQYILTYNILDNDGLVVVESSSKSLPEPVVLYSKVKLSRVLLKEYGDTCISFYKQNTVEGTC